MYNKQQLCDEHHIFPRSFLTGTKVIISFDPAGSVSEDQRLKAFLENNFQISDFDTATRFGKIEIKTDDNSVIYKFNIDSASIALDARKGYSSFEKSVYPFTRPLYNFVNIMAQSTDTRLSIIKKNLFRLKTSSPDEDIINGLKYILAPKRFEELPKLELPLADNVKALSFDTSHTFPQTGIELKLKIKVDWSTEGEINYAVKFTAEREMNIEHFQSSISELNNFLYEVFIDCISQNILHAMSEPAPQPHE